ncbi:MAG: extracellular solute-binding protein, partial [Pirellulaceae bacterium]|nr:extracellular solute-binding protein [Pirellulaceae bacterium]
MTIDRQCRARWFQAGWQLGLSGLSLLWIAAAGCGPAVPPPVVTGEPPATAAPIRLLVVDDPELAEAIGRQWNAHDERRLAVEQMASSDLPQAVRLNADAVIYPSGLLGELAESRRIVPFPAEALDGPQLARGDIFPLQLQVEGRWGGQLLAVPLGSPQFCLVYRRDLARSAGGRPPATWGQYHELAVRLAKEHAEAGDGSFHAVAEPLAAGWAGQVLLARAAPYARHRSQYSTLFNFNTMDPLIAGPPFVRALEELVAASRLAPPECLEWTPAEVFEAVRSGRAAMGLAWPSPAATGLQPADSAPGAASDQPVESAADSSGQLAFAELPGSDQVYSLGQQRWEQRREDEPGRIPLLAIAGRLGSVTAQSRRPAAAADALAWITGRDWSPLIAPASR